MYNELISYTFDAEEWTADGNNIDFAQLAYPSCLSEISYGDFALVDEKIAAKVLHLSEVELGYLAIHLSFQAEQLQANEATMVQVASIHQHFDLVLTIDENQICYISIADEPEKQVTMHLETLQNQLRNFRNNLWVDMYNHYPQITEIEDYENMEMDFIK